MDWNKISDELRAPFKNIKWRMGNSFTTNNKYYGNVYAYIDVRDVEDRLDSVVGPNNWKNEFIRWHEVEEVNKYQKDSVNHYSSQLCGISIYDEDKHEWITKFDGAQNKDIEGIKSGLSDAMKRAAAQWGIGRDVYAMDQQIVEIYKGKKNVPGEQKFIGKLNKSDKSPAYGYFWIYPNLCEKTELNNTKDCYVPEGNIHQQDDIHSGKLVSANIKVNGNGNQYVNCKLEKKSNFFLNFISNDISIVTQLNNNIDITIRKQGTYNILEKIISPVA